MLPDQFSFGFAWDFPFFPLLAESRVQFFAQRLKASLEVLPNHIDRGIVCDGFQGNVRRSLVDEALSNVAMARNVCLNFPRHILRFNATFGRVGQKIVRILGSHNAGAGKRERNA